MADSETDEGSVPETYTPRRTRYETVEREAPGGGTQTLRFRIAAGTEYTVIPTEDADDVLGNAPVSNIRNLIRESAVPA